MVIIVLVNFLNFYLSDCSDDDLPSEGDFDAFSDSC